MVALEVLLAATGSNTPAGAAAVAVLVVAPRPEAVPEMVKVTEAPAGRVVMVLVTALPATFTVPQVAPPVAAPHTAPTPVTCAGTVSANVAPLAGSGPLLITLTVYARSWPVPMVAGAFFTTARSATGSTVSVAFAASVLKPPLVVSAPTGIVLA